MNLSRIMAILLAITCVGLGAASLSLIQQNQELNTQLTAIDAQRQANSFPGMWPGDRAMQSGGLRLALESEQEANAELRREVARLKGEPLPPKATPAPTPTADTTHQSRGSGGSDAWLEQIKQQDPERYKQIVADREQRRKDAQDWYAETLGQLQARAQSPATPDEAALVNQISDTLAKLNDLRQQMQAARQLPDDQRQAQLAQLMPEMQATWQDLTKLREQDRALQYALLGKQLGLSEDKAQVLATSIPTINLNTQYTPRGGGGGSGSGGGTGNTGRSP